MGNASSRSDGTAGAKRASGEVVLQSVDGTNDASATLPPESATQPAMSSVADIVQNHLVNDISNENQELRMENASMEAARSCLTSIKIYCGYGGGMCVADLSRGSVIPDHGPERRDDQGRNCVFAIPFHEIPREELAGKTLMMPLDAKPMPLSELPNIIAARANQVAGEFVGISEDLWVDEDGPNPMIRLGENIVVQGSINGLTDEDTERFRRGDGAQKIIEFLQSGTGLNAENAELTLFGFNIQITPEIMDILDLLRECGEYGRGGQIEEEQKPDPQAYEDTREPKRSS